MPKLALLSNAGQPGGALNLTAQPGQRGLDHAVYVVHVCYC